MSNFYCRSKESKKLYPWWSDGGEWCSAEGATSCLRGGEGKQGAHCTVLCLPPYLVVPYRGWLNFESSTSEFEFELHILTRFFALRCLTLQRFNPLHAFTVNSRQEHVRSHTYYIAVSSGSDRAVSRRVRGFPLTIHPHQKHAVWFYCAPVDVEFAQTSRRLDVHVHGGARLSRRCNYARPRTAPEAAVQMFQFCAANGEKHEKRVQGADLPILHNLQLK